MNTTEQALFCPKCASALVDYSMLADEGARCNACGWSGRRTDLLATPFSHDMGIPDEVARHFVNDLRDVLSKHFAIPFGLFLKKWGFLPDDPKEQTKVLARYITAVARSAVRVVFQERAEVEKERATSNEPPAA